MKIAYLLFAYKNPKLIRRIVQRLSSSNSTFFIHLDLKSDIEPFASLKSSNVVFTERIPVYWAEFSGVRAMQILIRQALTSGERFDYLILLSGSEYPLKSVEYVEGFLGANLGTQFINLVKMPNEQAGKPMTRITTIRFPVRRPAWRFCFRVLAKFGLAKRDFKKYLGTLEPYGGNTWWALTSQACQYILDFDERNPHVAKFFENVFAPEEYFIHTVLGNSPFKNRLRRSLLFEDWSPGAGHPAMIDDRHIAFFESQNMVSSDDVHGPGELLFARKFSDESLGLLDRVDRMIEKKENRTFMV
jgi:hypothetical protein